MGGYLTQLLAVADAELRKLRHEPWELASRAIQPVLWPLLFGNVIARVRGLAPQAIPYLDFLAPGIPAQSVLFVAIFYGISAIWERDLGVLHRYLVCPAPRSALVSGKALSSGARALSQAVFVYFCAAAMGAHLSLRPANVAAAILLIALGCALFLTFSLIIACIVRTRVRFMGIGQVLTMPIFFASNAIYPVALMPTWLQILARLNPLTYEVDGLRAVMLAGGSSVFGLTRDFSVLAVVGIAMIAVATRMYPRMTE